MQRSKSRGHYLEGSDQERVFYLISRGITMPSTIAERLSMSPRQVKEAISNLRCNGKVTHASEGKLRPIMERCLLQEVWR